MAEIERRLIEDRASWLEWREEDVTASVAACLFGADVHPETTAYEQWALKSGLVKPRPIDAKLARRGHHVERMAPEIIMEERPSWRVAANQDYYRDPEARIGATPDLQARREDIDGPGVIDVKSVGDQVFRKWRDRDTGNSELPVWMAIQVNVQAALMGATWGAVAAITIGNGGLDCEIFDVPILPGLMANFRELTKDFWRRVEEKDPYEINWGRDAGTILDMYRGDDSSIIDLTDDPMAKVILMQREDFKRLEAEGAEAEKRRKVLDAQLIHLMGNARAARVGGQLIKAQIVRVKEAVRKAYTFPKISVIGHEVRETDPSISDELAQ